MSSDLEKKFDQIESMSKEEAIREIKSFFKGNKKFIDRASMLIYSSNDFEKISSMKIERDNWNWEKFLAISIYTKSGFKNLWYRKGNKKYGPENAKPGQYYNKTSEIEEFCLAVHNSETGNLEEYTLN